MPSIVASHAASPMVKAGKMMWKLMTNANWIRDSMTGSSSILHLPSLVRPEGSGAVLLGGAADPDLDLPQFSYAGHGLAAVLSRPSTTIFAVTIFVGQARWVKPVATAIFCAPLAV